MFMLTGKRCQTDIDECQSNPCAANNTVKCLNKGGTYLCVCRPGYVGKYGIVTRLFVYVCECLCRSECVGMCVVRGDG